MEAIPIVTIAIVMALLMIGMVLAAVELFVLPGFGLIGVLGAVSAVAAVAVAVATLEPTLALGALGGGVAGGVALGWLVSSSRLGRSMVLDRTQRDARASDGSLARLLGAHGTAITPLRPAGTVRIGDEIVDVVSQGIYVEAGAPVRVVHVQGARVLVEPAPAP